VRWLWGAFEQLRHLALEALPADGWQQVDTTALPVKHPVGCVIPIAGPVPMV